MRTEWHGVQVTDFTPESISAAEAVLQGKVASLGGTIKKFQRISAQNGYTGEKVKRLDAECEFA